MTDVALFHRLPLSLTLRAPWLVPGDGLAGPETDIALARDGEGRLVLPGTLIRGVLRGALERLAALVCDGQADLGGRDIGGACRLAFGREGGAAGDGKIKDRTARGVVTVCDLVGPKAEGGSGGVRVSIDPERGAAEDGKLLFFELPFPYGASVRFQGDLILRAVPGSLSPAEIVALLERALPRTVAIGGGKSAGFGRVVDHALGTPTPVYPATVTAPAKALTVEYRIDRPFLVDAARQSGNVRIGSDRLPGSAIKGTLAEAFRGLGRAVETETFLASLHVGYAVPVDATTKAARFIPPFSVAIAGKNKLVCALSSPLGEERWRFSDDWKGGEESAVRARLSGIIPGFATIEPPLRARTRTAVDPKTGGPLHDAERGGALFAETLIDPEGWTWRGILRVEEKTGLLDDLCGILQAGAPGFGSTGAVLTGDAMAEASTPLPDGDVVYLTLQSEARLFTEDEAMDRHGIEAAYARYFGHLGFILDGFVARQGLRGGYLAIRYPVELGRYRPWIVTEPGSVFRLRTSPGEGIGKVLDRHGILERGLPPVAPKDATWRNFPFLRENGFGRVVDLTTMHEALAAGMRMA